MIKMGKVKLTGKEKVLLISAPLMGSLLLVVKHYEALPDQWYGFFAGFAIGLEILLLINIMRRKRQFSKSH